MKFFIINLPSCEDRRKRIERRLKHHGIDGDTQFVNAFTPSDPLVQAYSAGCGKRSRIEEHACFLSHLHALRAFIDSGDLEGIILEDDAMFHNYFFARFHRLASCREDYQLIMLCHINRTWEGLNTKYKDGDICAIEIAPTTFGAQGYWLTREYALHCLAMFDKPLRDIQENFITSELITRMSGGVFANPPLVIEEAVYSTLRQGNDLQVHRNYMGQYDYENYSAAEEVSIKELW